MNAFCSIPLYLDLKSAFILIIFIEMDEAEKCDDLKFVFLKLLLIWLFGVLRQKCTILKFTSHYTNGFER